MGSPGVFAIRVFVPQHWRPTWVRFGPFPVCRREDSELDMTSQNQIRDKAVKVDIAARRERWLEEVKGGFLGEGTSEQGLTG